MNRLKTVILLCYFSVASVSASIITPALPTIEAAYSLSHGALEWVMSTFLLGYLIGPLLYAPIANHFGRLKALRNGLVFNLIGVVLCLFSVWLVNYKLLLLGRFIAALGASTGLSFALVLINELLSKEEAKRVMSFAVISFAVGTALAVTLGGVITHYLHWKDCFIFLLLHGGIMLLLTGLFPETLQVKIAFHPRTVFTGYLSALRNVNLVIFSVTVGLFSSIVYCYSVAAPLYAQLTLHLSPDHYGYWNLVNMVGMLGSAFLLSLIHI